MKPTGVEVGMEIADRYRLVTCRGRGGIGEVWEAEALSNGRRIALKLLRPTWYEDVDVRKRFVREGRLASTMEHRHIVSIHEVGETRDGLPYIAMELLVGPPLHEVIEKTGPMPWPRVRRLLLQVCGALDHAHSLKIIHRDVKPSNVMLASPKGDDERCKLVDFGLAKQNLVHVKTQHLTGEGQLLGSPGFMSPEQLQGRATDRRSDIYGLGCTGYFLLTGQVPFAGGSVHEMIHNALYEEPRTLEGVDLEEIVRQDVEAMLLRAIERDPDRRFNSVLDLVVAIQRVGTGELAYGYRTRERSGASEAVGREAFGLVVEEVGLQRKPLSGNPPESTLADTLQLEGAAAGPATLESGRSASAPSGPRSQGGAEREGASRGEGASTDDAALVRTGAGAGAGEGSSAPKSRRRYENVLTGLPVVDHVRWEGAEGVVQLARVGLHLVVVYMSGMVEGGAAALLDEHLAPMLHRAVPSQLFWHLATIRRYDSSVRDASLRCLRDHRDDIESVHVLNSPGRVGVSVTLAMMALGGKTHQYKDREAWRTALEAGAFATR